MTTTDHRLLTVDEISSSHGDDAGSRGPRASSIVIGRQEYHPRQVAAAALVAIGLLAIAVGWFGAGGNNDVWEQIPYLISGGIGGAALVALGVVVYVSYEHLEDRRCITELVDKLDELELGLAGEFDALSDELRGVVAVSRRAARRSAGV
ncbi:MAG TPA: hypothetical protein VFV35_00310 [Acidimicrobiales bacterium]|nr:hypothetical protein [Acidimicrobiales bacterium]